MGSSYPQHSFKGSIGLPEKTAVVTVWRRVKPNEVNKI